MYNNRERDIEHIEDILNTHCDHFTFYKYRKLDPEKFDFSTISDEKLNDIAQSMTIFEEVHNELDRIFEEEVPMKD